MNKPTFFLDALGELSVKPSKANDGCSAKVIQLYFEQSKSNGLFDRLTESIREPYKKSIRDHFWKMTFVLRTNAEYGECQGKNGNTPRMGVYDDIDVSSQLTLPGGQQYTMVTHHPKQWHTLAYLCISQLCHKPSLENWLRTAIHETAHNIGWGNYYKDAEQSSFDNFDQNERHPNQSEWRIPNGNDTSPNSLNCSFPSFR